MDQETLKRQMLDAYLRQQRCSTTSVASSCNVPVTVNKQTNELVRYETPDENNITLEEFKEYVKKWLEMDNMIKKAQEAIKERKQTRDKLANIISKFMCKYDIEDLNTKDGRIRCKVTQVKSPVSQKVVKQKIIDYFKNDEDKKQDIISKIYEERDTVQKVSLRRLKIN